jgi:hypothetical protein
MPIDFGRTFPEIKTTIHAVNYNGRSLMKKIIPAFGIKIVIVDGEFVRKNFYQDFTKEGHHYVYPWIPEGEIWFEERELVSKEGFLATIIHALAEYYTMMLLHWPYNKAHSEMANPVELAAREVLGGTGDKKIIDPHKVTWDGPKS